MSEVLIGDAGEQFLVMPNGDLLYHPSRGMVICDRDFCRHPRSAHRRISVPYLAADGEERRLDRFTDCQEVGCPCMGWSLSVASELLETCHRCGNTFLTEGRTWRRDMAGAWARHQIQHLCPDCRLATGLAPRMAPADVVTQMERRRRG